MFDWLDRKLKEFVTWLNISKKPTYLDNPLVEWESPRVCPPPPSVAKVPRKQRRKRKSRKRRIG